MASGTSRIIRAGGRRSVPVRAALPVTALLLIFAGTARAAAADLKAQAAQLSDSAFALLYSLGGASAKPAPALAPVANLAGDAQTMAEELSRGGRAAAASEMGAIVNDRAAIDAVAKDSPALNATRWKAIERQIAALEKLLPPAAMAAAVPGPPPGALPGEAAAAPRAVIASRVFRDGAVRVRGFVAGNDLRTAGVYDRDELVRDLDISPLPGPQRVNFDVSLDALSPTDVIRVTDASGREARTPVAPGGEAAGSVAGSAETIYIEPGAGGANGPMAPSAAPLPPSNVAEIAPAIEENPAEWRRAGSLPGDVRIDVFAAGQSIIEPEELEIVGQIAGTGVERAGVYLDGRLVRPIPVNSGGVTSFDVTLPMPPIAAATTIRAYGGGKYFVEASVDVDDDSIENFPAPPGYGGYPAYPPSYSVPNPYRYGYPPYAYGNWRRYGMNPHAPNPYSHPAAPPPGNRAVVPPAAVPPPPSWPGR
ncbi:MAG: hypothetical protein ACREQI_06810 [Candidatus Binataceae bacterium]